ncbi:MAG: hypothetical protein LH477_01310 [Nocardioides sp.]|nr:hypothetical protein [Nocardioides sp.]
MSEREPDLSEIEFDHEELRVFWDLARFHAKLNAAPSYFGPTTLEAVPPPAWSFGETPAQSDEFVAQVLADEAGETTAPVSDYAGDIPTVGVLSILRDGSGKPRALVEVSGVVVGSEDVVESFRVVFAT